jgi:vacuolar-type H+-ATPase subunit E/Vma4
VVKVSLEAILQAITDSGEAQVSQIEAQTRAKVEEILAGARQEAARVKEKAFNNAVAPAARERSRILHLAKLEVLHAIGGLRETLVDTALEGAGSRLSGIRAQAAYRAVLLSLTKEALAEIKLSSGERQAAYLEIDPRDRPIMDAILAELGLDLQVKESIDCWGGLVASSEDGRVVVINTLEARLKRATPYLRRYPLGLFEDKECQTLTSAMPAYTQ